MATSRDLPPITNFGSLFIKNQFCTKIPLPPKEPILVGKVAIITGSNSGLGLESAKQFLQASLSHLVIAVRSLERGKEAASKLRLINPKATIDVWALDMESYPSVHAFSQRCQSELSKIDIVILNAGLTSIKFETTASTGHEKTIQVNYLSTMLLALLLVPILKAKHAPGVPARLTIVNSIMSSLAKFPHRTQRPLLSSYDDTTIIPYDPTESYSVSKLLGQIFLVKLLDYVKAEDIIINMVEPGYTKGTGLDRSVTGALRIPAAIFKGLAGRPVPQGAATYYDATVVHGKESHGCFLLNCGIGP